MISPTPSSKVGKVQRNSTLRQFQGETERLSSGHPGAGARCRRVPEEDRDPPRQRKRARHLGNHDCRSCLPGQVKPLIVVDADRHGNIRGSRIATNPCSLPHKKDQCSPGNGHRPGRPSPVHPSDIIRTDEATLYCHSTNKEKRKEPVLKTASNRGTEEGELGKGAYCPYETRDEDLR